MRKLLRKLWSIFWGRILENTSKELYFKLYEELENIINHVKKVKNKDLIKMANEFNIYGGEAESLALYKQEKADLLISDDDNLRKKEEIINAKIIGSLAVILKLIEKKKIDKNKFISSIDKMREIGWFSNAILDKVLMGGEKYG